MRSVVRRWAVRGLVVVLVAALVPAVVVPGVAGAVGPSVTPEKVKSVSAQQQGWVGRGADDASRKAMTRDQAARTVNPGSGTPSASSLSPSAAWGVSGQSGDFTWSYPMRVPPVAGGLVPDVGLSYRSSAVDGRTSVTNNQPSWVGDGWDLWPGYIERTYGGCVEDDVPNKGDLCWRSDNATATYAGGGGMLICCDGTGKWRAKGDDGARIERLSGAGNGDQGSGAADTGEFWKITTVDGTQYFFGSQPDAQSTWVVPVFGDDAGEPCNRGGFDGSSCQQAWRWNLDKVVDRNGNLVRYFYEAEWNKYGLNMKTDAASYVRGGTLHHIDYGLHETAGVAASGRVDFTTADRCVPGSVCTRDKKDNWPDTALEHLCDAAPCATHGPTFWSTKRLASVTTNVRGGSGFTPVDRWELEQLFPDPGDGEKPALWLKSVKQTGLSGGSVTLPPVTFEGTQLPNRVYAVGDGYAMLNRFRITGVISESGGVISVNYAPAECSATNKPADEVNNTKRCFPVSWAPPGHDERVDYFHKYVVEKMIQSDSISSSTQQVTSYEYLDGAAWHWDTSEFAKDAKKTWNDFRGFGRIRVRTGVPAEQDPGGNPMTMTEQRFYRGMHGDRIDKTDKTKLRPPVTVVDSTGEADAARLDHEWLQGVGFESTVFERETASSQPNPPVVSRTVTRPVWQGPTAAREVFQAYLVGTESERAFTALASGGFRETKTVTTYDDRGLVKTVSDLGDVAVAGDDQCTTNTYTRNTGRWLLSLATRVSTVATACGATARFPEHAVAAGQFAYDDRGNLARSEGAKAWILKDSPDYLLTGTATYDVHGRITESVDTAGNPVKIKFTPAVGGPVTKTETTSAAMAGMPGGLTATTTLDPASGQPLTVVDANNRLTQYLYDPLGRTSKVWLPNRPRDDEHPRGSVEYTYQVRRDAPTVVTTTKIGPNGIPVSANTLFDGLLRPRQTQTPGVGMLEVAEQRPVPVEQGRLIVDTRYDSHGRVYKTTQPYFNDAKPDTNLWVASDTEVPGLTKTRFDGVGRTVESIYQAGAITNLWSTKISYGGDRVHTTPPAGGTATTVISDARGQTTEQRQYRGSTPEGAYDTTRYSYTNAGQLAEVVSPEGARWRYTYDLRGRKIGTEDPDAGATTLTYDDSDRLTATRDARGSSIATAYDQLGRQTSTHQGTLSGPKLTEITYDTAPHGKGLPASTTRYVNNRAYTTKVDSYTALNTPLSTTLTIPAEEGLLAGSYTTMFGYGEDGALKNERYPAIGDPTAGGLPEETVGYELDNWGRPSHTVTATGAQLVANTFYTRYGEVERLEHGSVGKRAWQTFLYDTSTRRPTRSIVDAEVSAPMQADTRYTYDPAGNLTSIADLTLDQTPDIQCQRHDHLRRLTEAWTPPRAQWDPQQGCTAGPSQATLSGPAPYWHSFTYSADGNRLQETQRTTGASSTRTSTYPTPTTAQPHTLRSVTSPAGAESYTYNAAGYTTRRVKPGADETFTWDAEGHLESVVNTATNQTTSYLYTADGARLLRKDSAGTTLYLGTQEALLPADGGKPVVTRYYKHGGKVVGMRQGSRGGLTWLAGDHQGTAQVSINTDAMSVQRRRQYPFGAPRGISAFWADDRGFVGGTNDATTGLTHLGAREYDPANGRFISVDPLMDLGDSQQMHGYSYANNSPVTFNDASGLACSGPDGIGCRSKASKEGFGDQRDPVNKAKYENYRQTWKTNHDKGNTKHCGKCGKKTSYVNNRGGGFIEAYDATENIYYLNDLPLPSFAPPASELIARAKDNYGGDITGAPGTEANLENTFASLISYCRNNLGYCGHDFFEWLSLEWIEFLGENGYLEGGGRSGGMGGLRSRLGLSPKRGTGGMPCSFAGDTQVEMADGTTKPIAEIKIGDKVLAADPETGERGGRTVTAVMVHKDSVLELVTEDGGHVTTTEDHPFWNNTDKTWQRADQLGSGDQLLTATGGSTRVAGLRPASNAITSAYNLTVDDLHTYHVRIGAAAVLVHNSCPVNITNDGVATLVKPKGNENAVARIEKQKNGDLVIPTVTNRGDKTVSETDLLVAGFTHVGLKSGQRLTFSSYLEAEAGLFALGKMGIKVKGYSGGYDEFDNDRIIITIA